MKDLGSIWKHDLLCALGIMVIGSLTGLLWNPSALRPAEITIQREPAEANYLKLMDPDDVLKGLRAGKLQIVDSRQRVFYEAWHIPGSLPVWDKNVEFMMPQLLKILPSTTTVVVADQEHAGFGGRRVAGLFAQRGYKNVRLLKGGLSDWRARKRPLISGWDFDELKKWAEGE